MVISTQSFLLIASNQLRINPYFNSVLDLLLKWIRSMRAFIHKNTTYAHTLSRRQYFVFGQREHKQHISELEKHGIKLSVQITGPRERREEKGLREASHGFDKSKPLISTDKNKLLAGTEHLQELGHIRRGWYCLLLALAESESEKPRTGNAGEQDGE